CERDPADCSAGGRSAGPELETDRAGALDERLLLLLHRNRHAEPVAAGHPARGSRLEKTTLCHRGERNCAGRNREAAPARAETGGITRSRFEITEADRSSGTVAKNIAR